VKLTGVLGDAAGDLGLRFNLLGILPVGMLVLFLTAMYQSGAFSGAPDVGAIARSAENIGAADSVWVAVGVVSLAVVLQPLQMSLVQLLEGYWGNWWPARALAAVSIGYHRRRRQRLQQATQTTADATPETREQMANAAWRLQHFYPGADRVLPTTLGNVLRAAEDRGGRGYGMDAVVVWPRLYPLLSPGVSAMLADQRDQLDLAARFCVVFLIAAIVAAATLATHGWWWLVAAVCVALAWIAYRAAVAAALAYGDGIQTAFDLHRFDLLEALHLELPGDREAERHANRELCDFWRQGVPINLRYVHKPRGKNAQEKEE
jgi:hypothetical protein